MKVNLKDDTIGKNTVTSFYNHTITIGGKFDVNNHSNMKFIKIFGEYRHQQSKTEVSPTIQFVLNLAEDGIANIWSLVFSSKVEKHMVPMTGAKWMKVTYK